MSSIPNKHLHDELATNTARVTVTTKFGSVTGGRASNGAAVWLEVPFALPPTRFADPVPLPEGWKYEEGKEYLTESKFAAQPTNNGQRGDTPQEDVGGFGNPTEDPLFVTIVAPPSFPAKRGFPVKVFIHGGCILSRKSVKLLPGMVPSPGYEDSVDGLGCRSVSELRI
ncbi:hypothetical protein EDD85DRAFT_817828 [Armillaria nabsnona]|nr:hypothetical protein EDD85DRAFT_817828 [Armillaria nabsnona]